MFWKRLLQYGVYPNKVGQQNSRHLLVTYVTIADPTISIDHYLERARAGYVADMMRLATLFDKGLCKKTDYEFKKQGGKN